jgi:hypothetical protein
VKASLDSVIAVPPGALAGLRPRPEHVHNTSPLTRTWKSRD